MSEQQPTTVRTTVVSVFISAIIGAAFGFGGGLVATDTGVRDRVLSMAGHKASAADQANSSAGSGDVTAPAPAATEEDRTIAAVAKASPAVVSIVISKDMPVYERSNAVPDNGDFFSQFFGQGFAEPQYRQNGTQHQEVGAGSGFIVSGDGYIVTNRHVVEDESADYTVVLQDGRKYDAKVLARDSVNDIAVVKIEKKPDEQPFPALQYGDSSTLRVGQRVIAIGYALGRFGNTVSTGIVSGLGRSIEAGGEGGSATESLFDVIQTDTAINPGNSGGPLLNLSGDVIGVNVAIVQGSQNIGFSLPINDVRKVMESVQKSGKISRPFFGVRYVMVTDELKKQNQLTVDYGALVARGENPNDLAVMPGSPADLAGIVENDIILEIDGRKLNADHPLAAEVATLNAGEKVTMKILHKGQEKTIEVTLKERE